MRTRRFSIFGLGALTIVVTLPSALAACGDDASAPATSSTHPTNDAGLDGSITTRDAGADARIADAESDVAQAPPDGSVADAAPARWTCPPGPFGDPLASGSKPVLVPGVPPADGFIQGPGVLEGPVWVDGALYMSQFENHGVPISRLLKWLPSGAVSIVDSDSGTNGLAVDIHGAIVAGVHKDGSISRFVSPGNEVVLAGAYAGARFDSPNDLALRDDGNIYFSDPDWQSPATRPQAKTRVYRVAPGGAVTVVDDAIDEPNGVTLSPDQAHLYVSGMSGVFAYDVAADGSVSGKKAFGAGASLQGSDGMGIDCAGNLYIAYNQTVVVLDATGNERTRVAIDGVDAVTNVAFGGVDRKTLFVTHRGDTSQGLHTMALDVPGLPY